MTNYANHSKLYKSLVFNAYMEMVRIPKERYEKMIKELKILREIREVNWDLVRQFKEGLEDVKAGRIRRVA